MHKYTRASCQWAVLKTFCAKILCLLWICKIIPRDLLMDGHMEKMNINYVCMGVCVSFLWDHKTPQQSNYSITFGGGSALGIFFFVSLSLPFPSRQFGSSEDLGGCIVCHLASETDTKSFGCDLFELMVQNIVSTPTPRGNFVGALGRYKWPVVHLCGQHTHAKPTHTHTSACTWTYSHMYPHAKHSNSHLSPYLPSICPAEATLSSYSYI